MLSLLRAKSHRAASQVARHRSRRSRRHHPGLDALEGRQFLSLDHDERAPAVAMNPFSQDFAMVYDIFRSGIRTQVTIAIVDAYNSQISITSGGNHTDATLGVDLHGNLTATSSSLTGNRYILSIHSIV